MELDRNKIEARAWDVLRMNNRGTHTVPSGEEKTNSKKEMYGHAWLWDSAAHAIGMAHKDPQFAAMEVNHILESQWNNGMIPNMRFKRGSFDGHLWLTRILHPHAHKEIHTSGITQPPMLAEAVQRVGQKIPDRDERHAFFDHSLDRLIPYHEWFYNERSPSGNGGIITIHPWEHGRDNSPSSIEPMRAHDYGVIGVAMKGLYNVIHRLRPDLKNVPEDQRANKDEGRIMSQAFVKILFAGYDYKRLIGKVPLYEDVHMNSIMIRANQVLGQLAGEQGRILPDSLQENMQKTLTNLDTMWDPDTQMYLNKDAMTGELVQIPTSGSLEPLYIGELLSADRISALLGHIRNPQTFGARYGIPSVPLNSPYYREHSYWAGSAWTYPEWLIQDGLYRAGRHLASREIANLSIRRSVYSDFHEYASAETAEGLGAPNFSWTAAQVIDMLRRHH